MAKPVKSKKDSGAKVARTEANKARRAARLKRKAMRYAKATRPMPPELLRGSGPAPRKWLKRVLRRCRQAARAHALGYGSHRARRKVEKANAARPPRSNTAHDIRPGEAVA